MPDALSAYLEAALTRSRPPALAVAFSGGPDSTALLHALAALPEARAAGLRALHVDHGLHADSTRWADHCRGFCTKLELDCDVLCVQVDRNSGSGLEAAARAARYAALSAALSAGEWLAAAHHREDQAETFLLRALRGSGPDGLAAMRAQRALGDGVLWRPLLDVPRQLLRDHLREHGLPSIEDPANLHAGHDRSWLRVQLLPLLRQRWPQADAALARSATLCGEAFELLDAEDRHLLDTLRGDRRGSLPVAGLLAQPAARRARLLRAWLGQLGLPPPSGEAIARVESDLLAADADSSAEFAWGGAVLRHWRGRLHAGWYRPALPPSYEVRWDGHAPLHLPSGDVLRVAPDAATQRQRREDATSAPTQPVRQARDLRFDAPLIVRARRGGERLVLPRRGHSHSLKHVLQDRGVPPWQRERLPLLFDAAGTLLAAGDVAIAAPLQAWLDAHGARLRMSWTD